MLERYGVELIGADVEAIHRGEDRERFKEIVASIGAESARSVTCYSVEECITAAEHLDYPVVLRPSFTMGGLGGGIAYDEAELTRMARAGLYANHASEGITPSVLIEESVLGWKEYELELMRDRHDNVVVVCSIENLDPMGVHTGDSITVAPAMTLTDREYQHLRDVGIDVLRAVGVDTGGCNIQFAIDPSDGRLVVIEMNPRVSRSSALASKATGFPIAKIAALLAIGYTLDEIANDITRVVDADGNVLQQTPAAFEPSLDYVVVKAPRFAFEKFPGADPHLSTTMKSVGEAMAIGRSFPEALGKALRSLEQSPAGLRVTGELADVQTLLRKAAEPTAQRLLTVFDALRAGASVAEVHEATHIDPWFLDQLALVLEVSRETTLEPARLRRAKRHGLSDPQIAAVTGVTEAEVRAARHAHGIRPVFKTVDTCAAEFAAATPYHYSTYDEETEVEPSTTPKVLILGSGPNRIGQGIEFDYACVHASFALHDAGFETVMVNCNPETVSTDYDTSDRLYFEPLTLEDVLEVVHAEQASGEVVGVVVQLGGQTPLRIAQALADEGVPIVGTSPAAIHLRAALAVTYRPRPLRGRAAGDPRQFEDVVGRSDRRDRGSGSGDQVVAGRGVAAQPSQRLQRTGRGRVSPGPLGRRAGPRRGGGVAGRGYRSRLGSSLRSRGGGSPARRAWQLGGGRRSRPGGQERGPDDSASPVHLLRLRGGRESRLDANGLGAGSRRTGTSVPGSRPRCCRRHGTAPACPDARRGLDIDRSPRGRPSRTG